MLWIGENTHILYLWKWYSGYYDKITQKERDNIIARCRGRINWATEQGVLETHKWKIFQKHANKIFDKYDPENKIAPDLYA